MADFPYEAILVADPLTFHRAITASCTVYDVNDTANATPLALKDMSGLALPNPITSSVDAFLPPLIAPSEGIKVVGAGLTVVVFSHQGMKDEAVAAKLAAQSAAETAGADAVAEVEARIAAGEFKGEKGTDGSNVLPTDTAIKDAIENVGSATRGALNATYGKAVNLETYPGVDPTGNTDSTAAIQAAKDEASAKGVPLVSAVAQYTISSAIRLDDNADLSRAVFNYSGATGTAIIVGAAVGSISRKRILTPYLIALAKTAVGWAQVAGTVGVQVVNTSDCDITLGTIRNFETGAEITGQGAGGGVTYSRYHLGTFLNNKRNLRITATGGGYANQCQTFGGSFNYDAAEGVNVPGTRHILIDNIPSPVDGWTFHQLSLEDSGGVCEYVIDCAGNNNIFDHCRYETAGTAPKVAWRAGSHDNEIRNGVNVDAIVEDVYGATSNRITRHPGMVTLTASKTVGPAEFGKTIISNAGGAVSYTLPDVAYISPGTRVTVKNVAASTLNIVTAANPVDGSLAAIPLAQWESASFISQQLPDHRWLRV